MAVTFETALLAIGLLFCLGLILIIAKDFKGIPSRTYHTDIRPGEFDKAWLWKKLAHCFNEAKLVSGEGNPKIYDDSQILSGLSEALKRGADIKLVVGPCISISDDKEKYLKDIMEKKQRNEEVTINDLGQIHGITNLVFNGVQTHNGKTNKVKMYMPRDRVKDHFRLIDNRSCYSEDPHDQLAEKRNAVTIENSYFTASALETEFDHLLKSCRSINTPEEMMANYTFETVSHLKAKTRLKSLAV